MFSRSNSVVRNPDPAESRPRTVHTPGAYPPLSVRPVPGHPESSDTATSASTTTEIRPSSGPAAPLRENLRENPTPARSATATIAEQDDDTRSTAGSAANSLIVGPDVKLKGAEILDCDTLIVEGRVEATMDSRIIRIAERGAFSGKVCIDIAEIDGEFEGELTARQKLVIHATGRVRGKIRYGTLLIESGGLLSGEIESLAEAKAGARKLAGSESEQRERATTNANVKPLLPSAAAG